MNPSFKTLSPPMGRREFQKKSLKGKTPRRRGRRMRREK
jgi:hypothetical protein